jgi:hypothetical protein
MGGVAIWQGGIQYPHINTPTEVATQQATLGDLLAQKQQREQTVQDNAVKMQIQQQALADQQALTNHIRNTIAAGGTRDQAMDTMDTTGGVSADAAAKFRDVDSQIKQRYAGASKETLANEKAQNDSILGDIASIKDVDDPAVKQAIWTRGKQNAIAKGYIKPNDPNIPDTYSDQAYNQAVSHLQGGNAYIEYGQKAQEAADKHIAAQNTATTQGMDIAGRTVPNLSGAGTPQLKPLYMAPGPANGLVQPGNMDLRKLPVIENPDSTYSTVNSTSFQDEKPGSPTFGKEVLVRGILNGQKVDPEDPAVLQKLKDQYYATGQHLGVFKDGDSANAYAQRLHEDWQNGKIPGVQMRQGDPAAANQPDVKQIAWSEWRNGLSAAAKANVPEQYFPDAETQVRNKAMTVEQQTTNQRAAAQLAIETQKLIATGVDPALITKVSDPKTPEADRQDALKQIRDQIVKMKGDAAAQEEIAKQLGVVTALLGGTATGASPASGQTPGAVATPPPASGAIQIPKEAPGQAGVTQLAFQNNNPGNVRFAGQKGARPGAGGYAAFDTVDNGYAAIGSQIQSGINRNQTLAQYISQYAPQKDKNNTPLYIQQAAQAVGASPDTPVAQIDRDKLQRFQANKESSTVIGGPAANGNPSMPTSTSPAAPSANGRNESVLDDAVKAGKISQGTANEIRAVADGAPYWPERTGALGIANQAKENLLGQYAPDYKPGQAPVIKDGTPEYKVAQDLAYGKLTMGQFRSIYSYSRDIAKKQAIYEKASELNPNFSPAAFEMGFTLAKNPKVQQQLASLDNVVRGVPDLLRVSDAASRSGVPILNKFILPGGVALGSKNYSNLETARTAFADELSGALGYGSATDMSREMGFNMTDPKLSADTFKSNVNDILIPFVERKRATLLNQMGVYGQPGMNPAASAPNPGSGRTSGGVAKNFKVKNGSKDMYYKGSGDTKDPNNWSEAPVK